MENPLLVQRGGFFVYFYEKLQYLTKFAVYKSLHNLYNEKND